MKINQALAHALATAALASFSLGAAAQSLEVKCETRSDRSKASVDGRNLASGNYSAVLVSGPNTAQSPYEATRGDEAEFDFDSNRRDIRQGATAIDQDFIVNNRATGRLLDAAGNVVAQRSVKCRRN
ncbi:MAG TPA: hypothetical protein VLA16_27875 [Ideonella sp.]|nr:hypothetical protein [Ideonella sp.]